MSAMPTSERSSVLDDVRRALGTYDHALPHGRATAPAPLEPSVEAPGDGSASDSVARFTREATAVGVHVHSMRSIDEAIECAATICATVSGEVALSGAEFLSAIDLRSALTARGLSTFRCGAQDSAEHEKLIARLAGCGVGVTAADYAIAESGTIVLSSAEPNALLVSLLPPTHVAVLRSSQIVARLDEAITKLAETTEANAWRSATFITGPSRTGDVELVLSIGVHGPKELHVIIVD